MRKIISIYAVMFFVLLLIPHASFASSGTADISPSEVKTDFVSMKDIEVTTSVTDSVYLNSITNGTYALIPGTDYLVTGSTVTVNKSYVQYYLNKFSNQNLYLSFNFSDGNSKILTIYRGSSPHPELITTSVDYYAGSSYDVKIQLILNGNFITSVQCGSDKFVQGINYTYSNETSELIINKGYLSGQFCNRFGEDLKPLPIVVGFSDGSFKTISINPYRNGLTENTFNIKVDSNAITDQTVNISVPDNVYLNSITNGTGSLIPYADYGVNGSTVTIKEGYLKYYFEKFQGQNLYLNLNLSNGKSYVVRIYTGKTPDPEFDSTYNKLNLDNVSDIKFSLNLNGNFITSVKNGTENLVQRIDYTYSNDTHELIIRKGYLKAQFPKTNSSYLPLIVEFTGGKSQIIVITSYKNVFKIIAAGSSNAAAVREDGSVTTWGYAQEGCSKPADFDEIKQIVSTLKELVALKENGSISVWDINGGTGVSGHKPDIKDAKAVAAAQGHALALKGDGTVIAWGDSLDEGLDVPTGLNNVKAIAAGDYHSVALKEDGTVVAWGNNGHGQCDVPKDIKGVKAIAAGARHTVALKEDGTVVAWGNNESGQCDVPKGLTNVKTIAARGDHTVVLKEDGTVVAWGFNYSGECNVPSGLTGVKEIATGENYVLALKEDGSLVAWGYNGFGQCSVPK